MSPARSVIPLVAAINTIISVDDSAYSIQRKRLRPWRSSLLYFGNTTTAIRKWKTAESNENAATPTASGIPKNSLRTPSARGFQEVR
jgi:hypothetical protein